MEYSIVIPVYNSQDSLSKLYDRISETLKKLTQDFEVIFIDDFSTDNSWEKLMQLKKEHSNVKLIRFSKNYGQHNATLCGFRYSAGDRVVTIDDDLEEDPADILLLIEKMNATNAELIYGIGDKNRSSAREIGSNLYKQSAKYVDGKQGNSSSFRLIESSLLEKIKNHKQHFIIIEELLFWYTEMIDYVVVNHSPRKHGKSGYSPLKIFKLITNTSLNYSNWPLKFMTYGGAVLSFVSFLLGLYFMYKKVFLNISVPGFTALIVAIFFSTSLLLLCFGIVGKYLNNIYIVLNNKPTYSIKEVVL